MLNHKKIMNRHFFTTLGSLAAILISLNSFAQGKYQMSQSDVSFFSATSIENIEASNKNSKGILDFDSKGFFIKIPVKDFNFPSDLMEEHFNENYMESEKYPDATFKGKFEGVYDLTKDGEYPVTASGDLTIHGVTQKRSIPAVIIVRNGKLSINSKFNVKLEDHKITIPTVVFNKIAELIEVKIESSLIKM
jgi:polyisoprenoid-binding protein YceI